MKGGFFDKPKGKEKKDKKKVEEKKAEPEPEPVYELSPEGEMIPTITKKDPENSSLVFDEVQQSMQQNILNPDAKKVSVARERNDGAPICIHTYIHM